LNIAAYLRPTWATRRRDVVQQRQSNVFVDLTSVAGSTGQAAVTDTLNTGGETTMAVDYLGKNTDGTSAVEPQQLPLAPALTT